MSFRPLYATTLLILFATGPLRAADWPMWRYDSRRGAATAAPLADTLTLQWHRIQARLVPTWEDPLNQDLMPLDRVYEPIILDHVLVLGFNTRDCVMGLDTRTGAELWRTYLDGPVRLPPAGGAGRVYCVSDDGHLYCLDVHTGKVLWSFRAGPGQQRPILGNSRLISSWPARGGPVLADGVVYFASGLFAFMGTFVCALDAETGAVIWTNDGADSIYRMQPHHAAAYSGVTPQGALVVAGDRLLVPCGRSVPACLDRHTGEFLYYESARYAKTGGTFVCAVGDWFINHYRDRVTSLYALEDGAQLLARFGRLPVATPEALYCLGDTVTALDLRSLHQVEYEQEVRDRHTGETRVETRTRWTIRALWSHAVDAGGDLIQAGDRLYAGGDGTVTALALSTDGTPPSPVWQVTVPGHVGRLVAGDDRLFAVTLEGDLLAFGAAPPTTEAPVLSETPVPWRSARVAAARARRLLAAADVQDGYALVFGVVDGELVAALAQQSDLHVIAVTPRRERLDELRRRFDDAGMYGRRVSVHYGTPATFHAPRYLASLTAFEDLEAAGFHRGEEPAFLEDVARSVRPYGGVVCFPGHVHATLEQAVRAARSTAGEIGADGRIADVGGSALAQMTLERRDRQVLLVRAGALPGAADWTHQYGDVANTVKSNDLLVRLPLGVLWFGGSSNMDVLPRHAHGPPEQVIGGRLFIEGIQQLSARDVYTGRLLWQRELPDLGTYLVYYDSTYANTPLSTSYNQVHIPGANARGTNFVATADRIYIAQQGHALVLDPATGQTLGRIDLPADPGSGKTPTWGYIGVYEDVLIAGVGAVSYADQLELTEKQRNRAAYNLSTSASRDLVVFDRHSGHMLWRHRSVHGLRHNAIVAGRGKLFCIDMPSPLAVAALRRRGRVQDGQPTLLALDIHSGAEIWRRSDTVFGTWLGYSGEHDILLQAGRKTRDTVADEPDSGMVAYRGATGETLWHNTATYGGPCILHHERIITDRHAYSLLSGEQILRTNPVTGAQEPWSVSRRYGCNYNIGGEYLLTFRSATAGYYDLEGDSGTGNLGSFRSGCTSNLVAANGVLNAPDYTRTCSCGYPLQTSVALIHDPLAALWTTYPTHTAEAPIRSLGINLGAPGHRRAPDGRFWLAHPLLPHVADAEKESGMVATITVDAPEHAMYAHHTATLGSGQGWPWVAASGCDGIRALEVDLRTGEPARYAVRLHFAEPATLEPGARVFDVVAEGRTVLTGLDIVAAAGGPRRPLVRALPDVLVADGKLTLEFRPSPGSGPYPPVLSGVEVERMD